MFEIVYIILAFVNDVLSEDIYHHIGFKTSETNVDMGL